VLEIRKFATVVDDVLTEGGVLVSPPARTLFVGAVIRNPWHGHGYVDDLVPGIDAVAPELSRPLVPRILEALGSPVEAYGKAVVVGLDGEVEHGSALIHTLKFGNVFRDATAGTTLLPAVEKCSTAGASFDIPLKHITDATTRSHHQAFEVRIADAPMPDEIIVGLAAASRGRPASRLPSFESESAPRED
jgi:hypothetical protein